MREIKFRGKCLYSEKWLYGHFVCSSKVANIYIPIREDEEFAGAKVKAETVGQYTGLTDIEGTEIYEGDILAMGDDMRHPKLVGWLEGQASFGLANVAELNDPYPVDWQTPDSRWWREHGKKFKVVGNKFDNPEMLEDKYYFQKRRCKGKYGHIVELRLRAGVRYFEDAKINGVRDSHDEPQMPFVKKLPFGEENNWCPTIDIKTGVISNWPKGIEAYIHYKVCDCCELDLIDENGEVEVSYDGYVPKILSPSGDGYGDYIIMNIDGEGHIADWKHDDFLIEEIYVTMGKEAAV